MGRGTRPEYLATSVVVRFQQKQLNSTRLRLGTDPPTLSPPSFPDPVPVPPNKLRCMCPVLPSKEAQTPCSPLATSTDLGPSSPSAALTVAFWGSTPARSTPRCFPTCRTRRRAVRETSCASITTERFTSSLVIRAARRNRPSLRPMREEMDSVLF